MILSEKIINKILSGELAPEEIAEIEHEIGKLDSFDFRPLIQRIFDLTDDYPMNNSDTSGGIMGFLNRIGYKRKAKRLEKRIYSGDPNSKTIVAEGDSWFEYPVFIKDILDWINHLTKHKVVSLAMGGNWIGNILYNGDYIHELSLYLPDAFLISGGGNDLVGNQRIALLIHPAKQVNTSWTQKDHALLEVYRNAQVVFPEKIVLGRKFLNKDFWALMNVFRFQYLLIFNNIRKKDALKDMKIITQGYDYPYPSRNRNFFKNPLRLLMKNGRWLDKALTIRGINDDKTKEAIMAAMIHEFNEMMIDIAQKNNNIYHIDCRGAFQKEDWADEMHLWSKEFKHIAKAYIECINNTDTARKVFKVHKR